MSTTLRDITHVEGHDDIYRGHRVMFLEHLLSRALPNIFHQFLNSWPKVKVKAKEPYGIRDENFKLEIIVPFESRVISGEFDASSYYGGDKQKFCDELDAFCKPLADNLLAQHNSGGPLWLERDKNHHSYVAASKIGDRLFPTIRETLGRVNFRGGKWCWFLIATKYRSDWPIKKHRQGQTKTLDEAKAIIEAAWKENNGEESAS